MSLISKIFLAFIVMIAIAVVVGVLGWRTVGSMDGTMNRIITYDLPAESLFGRMQTNFWEITVPQRSLLNVNLPTEIRLTQREDSAEARQRIVDVRNGINQLFSRGVGVVTGWEKVSEEWKNYQPQLDAFLSGVDKTMAELAAWENTTILNPDALLRDFQGYRGDHFQLATRLGQMISENKNSGPEINPADNLCGFGKWRERFEAGQEVYSKNPNLRAAVDRITQAHRDFHRTAAEIQGLLIAGGENSHVAINAKYAEHLAAARTVVDTFAMVTAEAEAARNLFTEAETFAMGEMRETILASLAGLDALVSSNSANMAANMAVATQAGQADVRLMQILAAGALGLGLLLMVVLFLTLRRQLTGPMTAVIQALSANAEDVSREARDVAASSASLSDGATSQSAAVEETSAAIEQITAMTSRNSDNARSANEIMQKNAQQIQSSTNAVNDMTAAMSEIKDSSEKIGNILKTIEEIAFQTNLLALNAAVEAARAGEAGKGFAVVADEVRNLAQRSAQAVKDTGELITGTVERVNKGASITEEIEKQFSGIADSTEKITRMIAEINNATDEQTLGMQQINQSISQIERVNQDNSKSAESNASSSEVLNDRSDNLLAVINDLGGVLGMIVGKKNRAKAMGKGNNSSGKTPRTKQIAPARQMKALPAPKSRK